MELTDDDVLEILKLFEQSKFEFLHLQQGERKITVSKAGYVPLGTAGAPAPVAPAAVAAQTSSSATPKPTPRAAPRVDIAVTDGGLVPITAPVVGKFYAAASPSDPPYVEQGAKVAAGTTVGLIEVMKVFTGVKAEVAGVIEQILVPSGEYVEFGQTLFLLRPHNEAA
jgi:acetyl-CoA carboxylase biotin carboxyl carrier protein